MKCSKCSKDFPGEVDYGLTGLLGVTVADMRKAEATPTVPLEKLLDVRIEAVRNEMKRSLARMLPLLKQYSALCKACWDAEFVKGAPK